jgi:hypothetical protein
VVRYGWVGRKGLRDYPAALFIWSTHSRAAQSIAQRLNHDPSVTFLNFNRFCARNLWQTSGQVNKTGGEMDWTIKVTDLAIVFATFVGPIAAVQLQKFLDRRGSVNGGRLESIER